MSNVTTIPTIDEIVNETVNEEVNEVTEPTLTEENDTNPQMISVRDFESLVWNIEGIRIIIRANSYTKVEAYGYSKSCAAKWTLAKWLKRRVLPKLPDDTEVAVINGDGSVNYSLQTQISTQRLSYNRYDV